MANASKKAKGTGTIRHKTVTRNGKEYQYWEGRVTVGADPLTGKQKQKSVTAPTQAEVIKKMRAIQTDIDSQSYIEPSKMSVSQWMDTWLSEYCCDIKPSTAYMRETMIRLYIKPGIGNIKLSSLNTIQVQKFYNSLSSRNGESLSPAYKKNIVSILHNALQTAIKTGIIKHNPADNVVKEKIKKSRVKVFTDKDIVQFLEIIKGNRYEDVFVFLLFTGLRKGEVCGLSWDDVDFDSGTITIRNQLQREKYMSGKYILTSTKNSKERTIKPAPYVMKMLQDRKIKQYKTMLSSNGNWNNELNLVFTNDWGKRPGRAIRPDRVYASFKKIVASMGIEDMRMHCLRHTYAVISLKNGDDIKIIQENLGHASAAFTLSTYVHVTSDMKDKSSERMEEYIEKIKQA